MTNTRLLYTLIFASIGGVLFGQADKKDLDKAAIKAMIGCYDVEFKYTETFAPEIDYEKHYDYNANAFEWAELVEETEDKIVIQHLLIVADSMLVKHWRQDWVYESDDMYSFHKDKAWKYTTTKDNTGKWSQKVYSVDDSPRYSGIATWTHVDGVSSWRHKADAPLPRREYSKRDDYNVMKRGNSVHITDYGWLHEQDNDKVIREEGKDDLLLAQEKGYNTYKRRPDVDCQYAHDWWTENGDDWIPARDKWSELFDMKKDLVFKEKLEGPGLYEYMFYTEGDKTKEEIRKIIDSYVDNDAVVK